MDTISQSDLIINGDGSIYHLHLKPEDIAETILLVGDPGRVKQVSDHFDSVELRRSNREFVTHTGTFKGKRISVLSTGIGTDNIDIVMNELDALVSVDLVRREERQTRGHLRLIRLGTTGALHPEIKVGSTIVSLIACGFDSLYHFYNDETGYSLPEVSKALMEHVGWPDVLSHPYFIESPGNLAGIFEKQGLEEGITISTPGFYAPQLRKIRLAPFDDQLIEKLDSFRYRGLRINNFEMECSALYALSALLGHDAITLCVAVANRISKTFLEAYKMQVDELIRFTLETIA